MDLQLATVTSKEEGERRIGCLNEKYDFEFELRPKDSRFQIFAKDVPPEFGVPDQESMKRIAQDIEPRLVQEPKEEAPPKGTESSYSGNRSGPMSTGT